MNNFQVFVQVHSVSMQTQTVRDWTNYTGGGGGGATKGEGGHMKFYPYLKRGAENVLAMLKGGHKKFRGSFYAAAWNFSLIVRGGAKSFHSLKGGGVKSYTLSWGGGAQKVSDTQFSHFVAPPPPRN